MYTEQEARNETTKILKAMYCHYSMRYISDKSNLSQSAICKRLKKAGVKIRTVAEAKKKWDDENATGRSITKAGYIKLTRGKNHGRREHRVVMEKHLGRKLMPSEHVHHIDNDKQNNCIDNLQLMSHSEHSKFHQEEFRIKYKQEAEVLAKLYRDYSSGQIHEMTGIPKCVILRRLKMLGVKRRTLKEAARKAFDDGRRSVPTTNKEEK